MSGTGESASVWPATTADGRARAVALREYAAHVSEPAAAVAFRSAGRLLIRGGGSGALALGRSALAAGLPACLVVEDDTVASAAGPQDPEGPGGIERAAGEVVALEGHLGAFRCRLELAGRDGPAEVEVDLVLDLGAPPLVDLPRPPVGYLRAGADPEARRAALDALRDLVGEFEKPRYFDYDPDRCAHGRSGIQACRRCLQTCPTGAITSLGDQVQVDPWLCQGIGSCATACPSGAIRYRHPGLADALGRLRRTLDAWAGAGGSRPAILFHDEAGRQSLEARAAELPEHMLPLEVEEIGAVGMDVWLAALAFGAARVGLWLPPDLPTGVRNELQAQLHVARALLEGMGYPAGALSLARAGAPGESPPVPAASAMPALEPARFACLDGKRETLRLALDHLHAHAPARRPLVNLPQGAPWGTALVDAGRCTLCMACVGQCPGGALQAGQELPQLRFVEANCLQCGLCCRTCPEDAIAISPRYLFDGEQRRSPRILHEAEPFACIGCGKAFATRAMIERIERQMGAHPLFQGEARRRLHMCEDCRVRDLMAEGEIS